MFVAIVMPAARKSRSVRVVVLIAIGLACLFRYAPFVREIPSGWALILCAVAASAIGALRFPVLQAAEGEDAE
jgi:predicted branched-subunit amino acid permease